MSDKPVTQYQVEYKDDESETKSDGVCDADNNDREAKTRAVKILAKSIYRDLEAQGFDEKQIVALATELISEVTSKISRDHVKQSVA